VYLSQLSLFAAVVLSSSIVHSVAMEDIANIVIPGGPSGGTCGYCSKPGRRSEAPVTSFLSATFEAIRLSCGVDCASTRPVSLADILKDRSTRV
jgi:hypothetical protein